MAHGWPSDKSQVPTALRHYYPFRDEFAVYHDVLFKSHNVLIPVKRQSTMLKKLHHGYHGGESIIRRAREVMYWPGMQTAILQESTKCSLCASYGSALPKEPMLLKKSDLLTGLLDHRNTPPQGMTYSPA